ncbi:unnamed protein product [Adineta steineri]|uniref:NHL repeat containing protein n=1 Tax=Adineta steineri TaxID=433720 RepID=A0A815S074_9BILA|nr:unnamed protein product [Adineta steineri]CAF3860303.1 unnamed protein product [Adineta steineri]
MNNRIEPDESVEVNSNTTRLRRVYEHFRKRKLFWIIFFITLIVVIIIIAAITATMKRTKKEKISTTTTTTTSEQLTSSLIIKKSMKWKQNAITIAGDNEKGNELNQLDAPQGIYIDNDDQSVYIADAGNHRIVRWKFGANNGEIVAGGNGIGWEINQLNNPSDVVLDKKKEYLIICDQANIRVMKWSRQNNQDQQILIHNIGCSGLAMDNNGDLYISDWREHQVTHWKQGDTEGIVVAGGNGKGNQLNQLDGPQYIFVDEYHSVYIADFGNKRVMKWMKDATEGTLVAPGQVSGENSSSMFEPVGVVADHMGNIYVSDVINHQIMRWSPGAIEGVPVVGEEEGGWGPTQLSRLVDLSFDRQGNLYVVDTHNDRIQKFVIVLD